MKKLIISICLVGFLFPAMAQKIDTTYYDNDWRGVKFKLLAQYIRYDFDFGDPNYDNKARIFYIGGQLESEGYPLTCNKFDGTKSKWKREFTRYYPSGAKRQVCSYDNTGALQGKMSVWDEKGNLVSEENYENGVLNGQSLVYPADNPDVCYFTQFEQGKPKNNEMLMCYRSGRNIKVDFYTKKLIKVKPVPADCKSSYKDGLASWYYDMNGIYVSLNFTKSNLYGKYYQCFIQFLNNTNDPLEINPDRITGQYLKGKDARDIELMPADEFMAKIARTQAWSQALAGASSAMANTNAGYSTTTTNGMAVGSGGWASGSATTTTYNPYERQAIMDREQQKLNNQASSDKQVKDAMDGSILKRTVVEPGEQLMKSFFIKYLSSDKLLINIEIDGLNYSFEMGKM